MKMAGSLTQFPRPATWVFGYLRNLGGQRYGVTPTKPNSSRPSKRAKANTPAMMLSCARCFRTRSMRCMAKGRFVCVLAVHEISDAPPAKRLVHYFSRLQAPLAGRQIELTTGGLPARPCRFLVCEDFGTGGLEGDTLLFSDPSPNSKSVPDFDWFWRNIGRSGKTGDDLGRWGLGKTVYRAASGVGSMFGLTILRLRSTVFAHGPGRTPDSQEWRKGIHAGGLLVRRRTQMDCRYRLTTTRSLDSLP